MVLWAASAGRICGALCIRQPSRAVEQCCRCLSHARTAAAAPVPPAQASSTGGAAATRQPETFTGTLGSNTDVAPTARPTRPLYSSPWRLLTPGGFPPPSPAAAPATILLRWPSARPGASCSTSCRPYSSSAASTASLPGVATATAMVGGQAFTFETGGLARLAAGSVLLRAGGTTVLATACVDTSAAAANSSVPGDGPQLQVDYRERLVAVGQLPGRADRREPPSTDREVLGARLVDRALRPLLLPGWAHPLQVVVTLLSHDGGVDPGVVGVNAASAALMVAGLPLAGPAGAVQVVAPSSGGPLLINPRCAGLPAVGDGTRLSLLYAGTQGGAVTALEAAADQVPDQEVQAALQAAAAAVEPLLAAQQQLAAAVGRTPPRVWQQQLWPPAELQAEVEARAGPGCAALLSGGVGVGKASQGAALAALSAQLLQELKGAGLVADEHSMAGAPGQYSPQQVQAALDLTLSRTMRAALLQAAASQPQQQQPGSASSPGPRLDGRQAADLRQLTALAGPLPRQVHGSALFSRGDTQSLASVTVAAPREGLGVDTVLGRLESRFHLHYTFPPYSTGEVGPARGGSGPNRREVGHGALAAKALAPLLHLAPRPNSVTSSTTGPSSSSTASPGTASSSSSSRASPPQVAAAAADAGGQEEEGSSSSSKEEEAEDFPFAVRVVVDTLSSSGSSSMAAVCSSALALKTAGVPLSALAAGISIGCITTAPPHLAITPPTPQQWAAGPAAPPATPATSSTGSACGPFPSPYGPTLLLVDIQGSEDHLGDMDFKVAGSAGGITALQLDTKLPGVPLHLVAAALGPATAARRKVLEVLEGAWAAWEGSTPDGLRARHGTTSIDRELVPRLVGLQGCNLLAIEEATGGRLVVADTGEVALYAPTAASYQHALQAVGEVEGRSLRKGQVLRVRVLQLKDYGAIVQLPNGMPALLHISELSHSRVREVGDVLREGQELEVLLQGRDSRGQLVLSRKALLPRTSTTATKAV